MNINALRTKISDTKKEYNRKLTELTQGAIVVSNKEMTGVETVLSAPFDFNSALTELELLSINIASMSAALAMANSTTKIGVGNHTIQSAIAKLAELRTLYNKVDYIVTSVKERISRKDAYGSNGASYFEVVKLNFDKEYLLNVRRELQTEINLLEDAISVANTNTEVSITLL